MQIGARPDIDQLDRLSTHDGSQFADQVRVLAVIKCWNVVTERYINNNRTAGAFASIITHQSPAQPARLDTDNRIDVRVEIISAPESLDPDGVALDRRGFAGERRFHHEAQKRDELGRMPKTRADNNIIHCGADLRHSGAAADVAHGFHSCPSNGNVALRGMPTASQSITVQG